MANPQLTPAHENLIKLCEELEDFRLSDEYTDVIITCENKTFKCHRVVLAAASGLFRTMFNSDNFLEERSRHVTLPSLSFRTICEVIQFIYRGDTWVRSFNVNDLLEASEFLQMGDGIERLCVEFIETYMMSAEKTLKMFVFACRTGKQRLIDILSRDIAGHVKVFSANDSFLEISLSDLKIILKRWSSLPAKNDEWLFGALMRWVFYKLAERGLFFNKIPEVINFENLNSEYAKLIFKKLHEYKKYKRNQRALQRSELVESIKPVDGYDFDLLVSRHALQNPTELLDVYVKHIGGTEEVLLEVFRMNSAGDYIDSDVFPYSSERWRWVRHVVLDDFNMYGLEFYIEKHHKRQSFDLFFLATNSQSSMKMKSPPLIFQDVHVCPLETNIYLYDRQTLSALRMRSQSTTPDPFNEEELKRGIYVYNCELDKWFPVLPMKKKLQDSCMTVCDRTLYLIGGDDRNAGGHYSGGYAQAYDYRVGRWRILPETLGNYVGADCCSINDSIYVCGGINNVSRKFERYDPRAGRWESLCPARKQMHYHQAISYSNKLWAIGGYSVTSSVNLTVEIYDPPLNTWSPLECIRPEYGPTDGTVLDGVVLNVYEDN